jgi:Ca-activated chloride channel homolog
VAPLRYGTVPATPSGASDEIAHLRLRYKLPGKDTSRLIETPVLASQTTRTPSQSLRFASAVAGFADMLRGGSRMDGWSWDGIARTARGALGEDPRGERAEMLGLIDAARQQLAADGDARVGLSR